MPDQNIPTKETLFGTKQYDKDNYLEMPIGRAIYKLAWPTIVAVLLENLATTIDMIMVGRLGPAEIASVGFTSMIFWLLSALVMGVQVSVTAIVARNIGANKPEEASRALGQALVLGTIASIVVIVFTFSMAPFIFGLFGVERDVFELSVSYLRILCFSQFFFAIIAIASGALRGAGDTRSPMFIMLVGTVIHIVLNYLLILGNLGFPALGVRGAAIGTTTSHAVTAVIYLVLLFKGKLILRLSLKDFKWDSYRTRQIVRLAVPASAEMVVLQFGLLIYARFIVSYGTPALSGYQVGMQVLSLSFIPHSGFGVAASTLIGQNLGALRKKEAKKAGWICVFWGMLSMGLMGVFYLFFSRELASIFVDDSEVIEIAASFIRIVAICQAGMSIHFTLSGALRGAGDTRFPLYITFAGMYGIRIPAAFVVTRLLGLEVWVAFSLLIFDYILRDTCILTRYARGKWLETNL
ncbi:MAG: MATE family efflux transporter [Proteobacteria bacterium]|nr:MATE family efflux transporter [Pseudomonadota bacterium]